MTGGNAVRPDDTDEVAALSRQVAALTDFVTTVTAALVADRALIASIVEALLPDNGGDPPLRSSCQTRVTVASIADDVLAIAGRRPTPSAVRLVYSVGDLDPAREPE